MTVDVDICNVLISKCIGPNGPDCPIGPVGLVGSNDSDLEEFEDFDDFDDLEDFDDSNGLECLSRVNDFKLYCLWCEYKGVWYDDSDESNRPDRFYRPDGPDCKWLRLLAEYPPCVLLVGCLLTSKNNKQCYVKKLPVELFTLLTQY